MANLSSFFPAIGGGGGFTKVKKYSTYPSLDATDNQQMMAPGYTVTEFVNNSGGQPNVRVSAISNGGTTASLSYWRIGGGFWTGYADQTLPQNFFVGARFDLPKTTGGTETITVTASTAGYISDNNAANTTITFAAFDSGGSAGYDETTTQRNILPPLLKFNPATNGLSDGDQIGYFMVGGGDGEVARSSTANFGGKGGKIIYGTATIGTATDDLIITPGTGAAANSSGDGSASTISGGLTLTTADGSQHNGWFSRQQDSSTIFSAGPGIMGYGAGGKNHAGGGAELADGWGTGAAAIHSSSVTKGGDGAVLIYY